MVMQFEYPRNALLDLSPINDAIDFRAKQQQRAKDNAYRDEQLGMQKEEFGLKKQEMQEQARNRFVKQSANIAQMIANEQNPELASSQWNRLVTSDPRWGEVLKQYGVDLTDFKNGPKVLMKEAEDYMSPLERDKTLAQIDASKAQAQAARAQAGDQYGLSGGIVYNKRTGEARPVVGESDSSPWKDPKQKADVEEGLRKEVTTAAKNYNTVRDAARSIEAIAKNADAAKTGALDMSLVFSFMKVLDPDSVVREAEYASAAKSAGLPDRVVGAIERVMSGKFLSPEQRAEFMGVATTLANTRELSYREGLDRYRGISERLKVDPRNVLPEGYTPPAPPPGSTNVPGVTTTPQRNQPAPQGGQQAPQQQGQGGGGPSPVRVQSAQDAMKLPPGTVFVTPDGRIKVRP